MIARGNLIYDSDVAIDTGLWSAEIYNNVFYEMAQYVRVDAGSGG